MLVVPLAVAGTKEKVLEELLHGVVLASVLAGLYPRTAIQVIVQVVHDDGSVRARACARRQAQKPTCPRSLIVSSSVPPLNQRQLLAAAINGAMLALLDAGISMRATVTAATAAFLPGSPDLLLDPTAEETAVRAVSTPRGPPSLAHTHPMALFMPVLSPNRRPNRSTRSRWPTAARATPSSRTAWASSPSRRSEPCAWGPHPSEYVQRA